MKRLILQSVDTVVRAAETLKTEEALRFMEAAATQIAHCFQSGCKLLIVGNGGSLCDAMHFAEELTGQFRHKREALPAIALADPGHMSCVANDLGFERVFAMGVEAFGKPGDLLIALTTSGNSPNIALALTAAKALGLGTIAFLGKKGGCIKGQADLEWIVSGFEYSDRIQEAHMAAIHVIIEMVEAQLFSYASQ